MIVLARTAAEAQIGALLAAPALVVLLGLGWVCARLVYSGWNALAAGCGGEAACLLWEAAAGLLGVAGLVALGVALLGLAGELLADEQEVVVDRRAGVLRLKGLSFVVVALERVAALASLRRVALRWRRGTWEVVLVGGGHSIQVRRGGTRSDMRELAVALARAAGVPAELEE